MKKRKGNPYAENYNQYSEMKQEPALQHTNSFTFGYNVVYDNNQRDNASFDGEEENFSNENESLKEIGKGFEKNAGVHRTFQTPKPKYESSGFRKKRNLAF